MHLFKHTKPGNYDYQHLQYSFAPTEPRIKLYSHKKKNTWCCARKSLCMLRLIQKVCKQTLRAKNCTRARAHTFRKLSTNSVCTPLSYTCNFVITAGGEVENTTRERVPDDVWCCRLLRDASAQLHKCCVIKCNYITRCMMRMHENHVS